MRKSLGVQAWRNGGGRSLFGVTAPRAASSPAGHSSVRGATRKPPPPPVRAAAVAVFPVASRGAAVGVGRPRIVAGLTPNKRMQPTGRTIPNSVRALIAAGAQRNVRFVRARARGPAADAQVVRRLSRHRGPHHVSFSRELAERPSSSWVLWKR
jgi:hypothetical protein